MELPLNRSLMDHKFNGAIFFSLHASVFAHLFFVIVVGLFLREELLDGDVFIMYTYIKKSMDLRSIWDVMTMLCVLFLLAINTGSVWMDIHGKTLFPQRISIH